MRQSNINSQLNKENAKKVFDYLIEWRDMLEKNGTYRRKKFADRLRPSQLIVLSTIFTSRIWLAPSAANAANQTIERATFANLLH